ncbi:7398_t:CDS:2 [Racocetra fulgida]|uniref:7398_t:CDS:1 n=1 Tax=Racocetra fulgida TaxID=60492 RepID=A0A9N9A1Q2_9GLOM|nr:7398_t:CDS:2 [Racocetra fulgida]
MTHRYILEKLTEDLMKWKQLLFAMSLEQLETNYFEVYYNKVITMV